MKFTRTRDALDRITYTAESETHRYVIRRSEERGWKTWWTIRTFELDTVGTMDPIKVAGREVGCDGLEASLTEAKGYAEKHAEGEKMPTKKSTPQAETVEVDETLADALEDAPEVDPLVAKVEQAQANIDRAVSLAEAENVEGLAELAKEHEELVSSMPQRGKIPDGTMTWAAFKSGSRADFRKASQAQPKPEPSKAVATKPEAVPDVTTDYTMTEGVADIVNAGADLVREGVKLHVKGAQTARQIAGMLLDTRRRIVKDGVPDLKANTQAARNAAADMYAAAEKVLATETGEAEHAKSLVGKLKLSVRDQMSDVLVEYVRKLDESPEEVSEHFAKVTAAHPDLSPSDAVFTFYDIPRMSRRELAAERQREKARTLKELEAKAEEGDSEAAEKVEELKAATVQERVAGDVQKAETAIKAAIKAAKDLDDADKAALKAKLMELVALAASL